MLSAGLYTVTRMCNVVIGTGLVELCVKERTRVKNGEGFIRS